MVDAVAGGGGCGGDIVVNRMKRGGNGWIDSTEDSKD
jgi:hypothetical protein